MAIVEEYADGVDWGRMSGGKLGVLHVFVRAVRKKRENAHVADAYKKVSQRS